MKNTSRILLFAVLPLLAGCPPREEIRGRVISLTGPVPNAAVLGMVWIEDADKIKPIPDIKGMSAKERTDIFEADISKRGLPAAYARTFTDENGWFTLDKFHYSGETKKAVRAMKNPKVSRVTVAVFQRGYAKGAVTSFPKEGHELPYATIILTRPGNWKDLADDNSYETLRRGEFYFGYSKEFGATKEEKNWFLEYTHSNLYKAYTDSDVKANKKWEETCGHDYSDVLVSTAGMQRNPAHERCGELLEDMGWIRNN